MRKLIFLSLILIQIINSAKIANADENGRKAAELLAGLCYYGINDLSKISSMAKSLGWRDAPEDMIKANRPIDGSGYQMWQAHNINGPVFVSINKGVSDKGENINICSIVVNVTKDNLLGELTNEMALGKAYTQKEPFQVLTTYTLKNPVASKSYLQIIHDGRGGKPINVTMFGIFKISKR